MRVLCSNLDAANRKNKNFLTAADDVKSHKFHSNTYKSSQTGEVWLDLATPI